MLQKLRPVVPRHVLASQEHLRGLQQSAGAYAGTSGAVPCTGPSSSSSPTSMVSRAGLTTALTQLQAQAGPSTAQAAQGPSASHQQAAPARGRACPPPQLARLSAPQATQAAQGPAASHQQAAPAQGSPPRTLEQLQALLAQASGPLNIDLRGRVLSGQLGESSSLRLCVQRPGLTLRNGTLKLPKGSQLLVTAQGSTTFSGLSIHGGAVAPARDQEASGLVTAQGPGVQLAMQACKLKVEGFGITTGVLALAGAHASLDGVKVAGDHGFCLDTWGLGRVRPVGGIVASGQGSKVHAARSHVKGCYTGFLAAGTGSYLQVGRRCSANGNFRDGFAACKGGVMKVRARCEATGNGNAGFLSEGKHSVLVADEGCSAKSNRVFGFGACDEAELCAGPRCEASGNLKTGFYSRDKSKLKTGAGCSARGNRKHGFAAYVDAQLTAGPRCSASNNGYAGFCSMYESTLVTEEGCSAEGNTWNGFSALAGAVLQAGPGSQAGGNRFCGFTCYGKDTIMVVGSGCLAEANLWSGFKTDAKGELRAGPGCMARWNGEYGWRSDAVMELEPGCNAFGNVKDDFSSSLFGKLHRKE